MKKPQHHSMKEKDLPALKPAAIPEPANIYQNFPSTTTNSTATITAHTSKSTEISTTSQQISPRTPSLSSLNPDSSKIFSPFSRSAKEVGSQNIALSPEIQRILLQADSNKTQRKNAAEEAKMTISNTVSSGTSQITAKNHFPLPPPSSFGK